MNVRPLQRLLLVTGMSGAGKSTVLNTLEDLGWEVVDNMPLSLLQHLLETPPAGMAAQGEGAADRPLAIGVDTRTRAFDAQAMAAQVRKLARDGKLGVELLYLDCSGQELARRYHETRRRHPLALDRLAEDGIAQEREMTFPLRRAADQILDTSDMTTNALQAEVRRRYGGRLAEPVLTVMSFGFARGLPRNADTVFDMRFLQNPHWVDELRPLTGEDERVAAYVEADPRYPEALDRMESLLDHLLPGYREEGKSYVTIAVGCTGGRHRSVRVARDLADRLRRRGFSPTLIHRDLAQPPRDLIEGAPRGAGDAAVADAQSAAAA